MKKSLYDNGGLPTKPTRELLLKGIGCTVLSLVCCTAHRLWTASTACQNAGRLQFFGTQATAEVHAYDLFWILKLEVPTQHGWHHAGRQQADGKAYSSCDAMVDCAATETMQLCVLLRSVYLWRGGWGGGVEAGGEQGRGWRRG